MVSFKLLSVVSISLLAASVVAQDIACYNGGRRSDCSRFIEQFCNHATSNSYAPSDSMSRCFSDVGSDARCDLTVWLKNPASTSNQTPSNANCKSALRTVMQSCSSGGVGQFRGRPFQFAIDPNGGQCRGDVANGSRVASAAGEETDA